MGVPTSTDAAAGDRHFNEDIPVTCKHCRAYPLWWEFDAARAVHYLVDDHGRRHAPHCDPNPKNST